MIEIDLIKKHGKKALGLAGHAPEPHGWRARLSEVLLEVGIIVFAITRSIWLHSWQEHRHQRLRERQFLLGLRQDLAADLREMAVDSAALAFQRRGLRYFQYLKARDRPTDSVGYYGSVLTSLTAFRPNDSRFQGLKSSGALAIVEKEAVLEQLLSYYERTTANLTGNSKAFAEYKRQTIGPYLDLHLPPDRRNLVAVLQQAPLQNYLAHGEGIPVILALYHETAQQARQLRQRIGQYLAAD